MSKLSIIISVVFESVLIQKEQGARIVPRVRHVPGIRPVAGTMDRPSGPPGTTPEHRARSKC